MTVRRRRWAGPAAALCLTGLGLSGCGQLPVSEQVRTIRPFDPQIGADDPVEVRKFPHGPVAGQSPDRVVEGFIGAADADDPHHNAARAFLATGADWDDSTLTVYDATTLRSTIATPRACLAGRTCRVRVSVRTVGIVKPDGRYQPSVAVRDFDYVLERDPATHQWEITVPAATALITTSQLARGYQSAVLYFLSRATGALVPQPILLADSAAGLPTSVTSALLQGPPAGLTGVLTTAIPAGSTVIGSVTVVDDHLTADVRLHFDAGQTSQQAVAWTQLERTLSGLPHVDSVTLQLDGLPVGKPAESGPPDPDAAPPGSALVIRNQHVVSAGPVRPGGPDELASPAVPALPVQLAVSAGGDPALLTLDGRLWFLRGNAWRSGPWRYASVAWLGPSRLLAVPVGGRAMVLVDTDGTAAGVPLPLPAGQPIEQLAVSPDGSRIVVIAGAAGARSAYLGRIGRDAANRLAVGGTGWVRIAFAGQDVRSVDWSSPLDVVALVATGPRVVPTTLSLLPGSAPQTVGGTGLPGAPASVAGASGAPLLAGVAGQLYRRNGMDRWVPYGLGIEPAYPG